MTTGAQLVQSTLHVALPRVAKPSLEPVYHAHPARGDFENFIAARFGRAYGARVTHFLPHLLGVRDGLDRWQASAGYAAAAAQPLFLEQYLDRPIERVISAVLGRSVARAGIVEVGNLAAVSAGMARAIVPQLARHLQRLGYSWVAFTATRALRNTFQRLGLHPLPLAPADRARLPDGGASWGTYYDQDPVVMAGKVSHGVRAGEGA